ncbi:MAG: 30S ribosomal protein S12 methylthiotransferase RimO [Planctomycetes bacterium]|nr:30S ribosomal protein S12 methylthiotransferase RimO [Planctomycetota bacterium]
MVLSSAPKSGDVAPVRVALVHLGCARNQIDSEVMLGHLADQGVYLASCVEDAEVAILNTCAFIGPAREESEARIRDLVARKQAGELKGVVVAGCLPQLRLSEVEERFPEVDAFLQLSDYSEVPNIVSRVAGGARDLRRAVSGAPKNTSSDRVRLLASPPSYAYLRISEGCDHQCSFCIIPTIRGKMRSKPIETLVEEARQIADLGVPEIVVVAEDSTGYGRDLGQRHLLPRAIEALADVPGIAWVRVMYAYPNDFPWDLTRLLREHPRVVPYLDIPTQHIATNMLRAMRRAGSGDAVRAVLERLRSEVPGIALRTTLLVGFPGESEADFAELEQFVESFAFDRLGAFAYSPEPGTSGYGLPGRVDAALAEARRSRLLELQGRIVRAANQARVGETLPVLIDEVDGKSFVGRTERDAPEVDCAVLGRSRRALEAGSMIRARVLGVSEDGYDLRVEVVS